MLRVKGCRFKYFTFTLLMLIAFGGSCLKPPALPQWDISLKIPVYRRTIRLGELLSNSEKFQIQPDSSFVINLTHRWGPVAVDNAVSLLTIEEREKIGLEDFVFSNLGSGRDGISCEEIFGPIPDSGLWLQIEPFSDIFEKHCAIENIQTVDILEGVVIVRLENRTPLNFDSIGIKLLGTVVHLGGIRAGEFQEEKLRLGGARAVNPIDYEVVVHSMGSGRDTVRIFPRDSLVIKIEPESLKIGGGRLKVVDAQAEKKVEIRMVARNPLRIDSLVLSQGQCVFTVGNRLPAAINLNYDFRKIGVSSSRTVEAEGGVTAEFNLSEVGIDNLRKTGGILELQTRIKFDSRGEFVDVTKDCAVDIGYVILDAKPRFLAGMFREPVYVFSHVETLPELVPFNLHGVRFSTAQLVLAGENGVGFPMDVFVTLKAIKNQEIVATVEDVITVMHGQRNQPGTFERMFPIATLLNTGPDFITCEYNVRMRGYGRFESGQSVSGSAVFNVPMRLAFVPDTVILPDKRIELSEEERQSVQDYLVDGQAGIRLKTALPFGMNGRLVLKPGSLSEPNVLVDSVAIPFVVPAGVVNNQGRCVAERDTAISVCLDSMAVTVFRSYPLSARLIFEFPATDTVVVYTNDQIKLDATVEVRIRVNRKPQ